MSQTFYALLAEHEEATSTGEKPASIYLTDF
jgi:hypothetical protein